jgi:putative FmdB family regulatory protein
MPLFEYQCDECGVRFERLQRNREPNLEECPECGGPVRRLIQPPGIIFKGSGFYVTDNRRSSAGTRRSNSTPSSENGGESSESDKSKADKDSE